MNPPTSASTRIHTLLTTIVQIVGTVGAGATTLVDDKPRVGDEVTTLTCPPGRDATWYAIVGTGAGESQAKSGKYRCSGRCKSVPPHSSITAKNPDQNAR